MTFQVGIDIGGTFTDAVVIDDSGGARLFKTPTTLDDPSRGVNDALTLAEARLGLPAGELLASTEYLGLGTTVATNAMIERQGVRTGLITTRGFRDTLLMQRGMGQWTGLTFAEAAHYSARRLPDPLVPRTRIAEVTERVDYKGERVLGLDEDEARAAIARLIDDGVEAIAVCLLWSFRDPAHERRVKTLIEEIAAAAGKDLYVTLSSDLAPVIGEYERMATTAMNAYLGPAVRMYMDTLQRGLADRGLAGHFRVMDSAGGVMSPSVASREPVALLSSGPAGGVLATVALVRELGIKDAITTDMGGTSFDVSLIVDGQPTLASTQEVAGYHVLRSAVDVTAIGAGGGSIAAVADGALSVGPRSAGSYPGPVCYGRGGTQPTVTDADVVLGILDPAYFLDGRLALDKNGAIEAIRTHVAEPLGISVTEAAAGIKRIADSQMADLLDTLTVGKGYDPRDFTIVAYGGASAVHAHAYAADLGVASVIVPHTATVHSAYGAAISDLHAAAELTSPLHTPPFAPDPATHLDAEAITATFTALEERAFSELAESGAEHGAITVERFADISYRMQVTKLTIAVPGGPLDRSAMETVVKRFDETYDQLYGTGSGFREAGLELTTFRVHARAAATAQKPPPRERPPENPAEVKPARTRVIGLGPAGQGVDSAVYRGDALLPGAVLPGPAVIEYPGTTVVVGTGQTARIDQSGNTILTVKDDAK